MKTTYNQYAKGGTTPMYKHGGTHPTEKERGIRAQDYKQGQPLTENQLGFLTQSLSDEERELFQDMYSQGLIRNDSVKSMFQQGKPMSASDFRESVLKDSDGPATTANLNREFGKMFGDGMKSQTQGSGLAKAQGYAGKVNSYTLKADRDVDPTYGQDPKGEDMAMIDPRQPDSIPQDREKQIIEQLIKEDRIPPPTEKTPDPIKVIKELEASGIPLTEENISDYTGTEKMRASGIGTDMQKLGRLLAAQAGVSDSEEEEEKSNLMDAFQELEMGGRIFNRKRTHNAKQLRDMLDADRRRIR